MVVVVVVTYSAPAEVLEACVRSVLDADPAGAPLGAVVVVDNGGHAVLPDDLLGRAVPVELVVAGHNRGFGAGANLGFARARELSASGVVLLNDDVVVDPGWLPPLLTALGGDDHIGAVQPLLLLPGDPPRVNSAGVRLGGDAAGNDIGYGEPVGPPYDQAGAIEIFTGGAVLFDAGFLAATGGFDERYVLYYEDVDLALRGRELGWRYRFEPASRIVHAQGTTTSSIVARTAYLRERNRLRIAFRFLPAATIARALWLSVRRVRHAPRRVHLRALLAGLGMAPGALVDRLRARRDRT